MPNFYIQQHLGRFYFSDICSTKAKLMNDHDRRPPIAVRAFPAAMRSSVTFVACEQPSEPWSLGGIGGGASQGRFSVSADWCSSPVCSAEFVRRLRYCEYLGKYFCDCCHSHLESCIPARILTMWDFRKYYVSNFSKRLLDSIWHQPIFNLLNVNYSLYAKAKELGRVRVSSCPFRGESSPVAERVLW